MHTIIRSGLIPGRRSLKRWRQSVFFTSVNQMDDDNGMEETPSDLTKPRIAPYKNTWKPLQNTVYWCNLKLAQQRGLQFCQTRSHAFVFCNTLPAFCIGNAVCMKTKEEQYFKVCLTPRLPRVVLKPNSHSGQQDQQDARSSWDPPTVDYRIPGILLSTVEQQDTNRKDKVKRLIQQFENHPNKESFLQDLKQTEKINKFCEKSQELITDEQQWDLRTFRDLFQKAVRRL